MSSHPADEAFAQYLTQVGVATFDQIEAARAVQAQKAGNGERQSLADILVTQGVLTASMRENIEKKLQAKQSGGVKQLGPYKLIKKLGEGGMGAVFLAEDTNAGRQVAVKVLPQKHAKDSEFLNRFRREAKAAGKLNHLNIVAAYSVGEEMGHHFYSMEYCEGEPLDARLKRQTLMPWDQAVDITLQVARGLDHAHKHGVIHRDIKPANIFVTNDGVAKILDLGLSKNILDAESSFATQTGVAIGTPHYISPEQARGQKDVDGRTDIYSLGATFYHFITGQTPFQGSTAALIMMKHLSEELPNPQDLVPELPDGVVEVIQKMMAKEPHDRYADCAALIADLELIQQGKPPAGSSLDIGKSSIAMRAMAKRTGAGAKRGGTAGPLQPVGAQPGKRGGTAGPLQPVGAQPGRRGTQQHELVGDRRADDRRAGERRTTQKQTTSVPLMAAAGLFGLGLLAFLFSMMTGRNETTPPVVSTTPPLVTPPSAGTTVATPESAKTRVEPAAKKDPEPGRTAAPAASTKPAQPPVTIANLRPGLAATYLYGTDPENGRVLLQRVDPNIDFHWDEKAPAPEVPADQFSVRWVGFLRIPKTGRYNLDAKVDDDISVWLDGERVPPGERELAAGDHALKVTYVEKTGVAFCRLQWAQKDAPALQSIPPEYLFHLPEQELGPAVATQAAQVNLTKSLSAALAARQYGRTDAIGGQGGNEFEVLCTEPALLVGLDVFEWNWDGHLIVGGVQPVFRGERGLFRGQKQGWVGGKKTEIVAREGYAVGEMRVEFGLRVDAIELRFLRVKPNGIELDPADAYTSPKAGGTHTNDKKIPLGTSPAVGIWGRRTDLLHAIGLMQLRPGATPYVTPVPPSTKAVEYRTFKGHTEWTSGIDISSDEKYVIAGSKDKTLRLWNAENPNEMRTLSGHTAALRGVAIAPNSRLAASGAEDNTLRIWDVEKGTELLRMEGVTSKVNGVAFSPDSTRVAAGLDDSTLAIWHVTSGKLIRKFTGHSQKIMGVAFSPDGKYLLSGGADRTLRLWATENGAMLKSFSDHLAEIHGVCFSPDGKLAASASEDTTVRVYNLHAEGSAMFKGHTKKTWGVVFLPDGKRVLSAGEDNTVRLWEALTGKEIQKFDLGSQGGEVRINRDGTKFLVGLQDKTLRLWKLPGTAGTTQTQAPGSVVRPNAPNRPANVPADAVAIDGRWYKAFHEPADRQRWDQARSKCEQMGGRLSILRRSDLLQMLVEQFPEARGKKLFIGGYKENGEWKNIDGTVLGDGLYPKYRGKDGYILFLDFTLELNDGPGVNPQGALVLEGFICEWPGKIAQDTEPRELIDKNFNTNWIVNRGEWKAENNKVIATPPKGTTAKATYGQQMPGDMECTVRVNTAHTFFLNFLVNEKADTVHRDEKGVIRIGVYDVTTNKSVEQIAPGNWAGRTEFVVRFQGGTMEVLADGTPVIKSTTAVNGTGKRRSVALFSYGAPAEFTSVKVSAASSNPP
ncbi:MAG TPA: protein kinase [Planctomycetota bacterium]|nr:protein kinase [Planctomycetota bacterium]